MRKLRRNKVHRTKVAALVHGEKRWLRGYYIHTRFGGVMVLALKDRDCLQNVDHLEFLFDPAYGVLRSRMSAIVRD